MEDIVTIADLIKALSEFPPETKIGVEVWEHGDWQSVYAIDYLSITKSSEYTDGRPDLVRICLNTGICLE